MTLSNKAHILCAVSALTLASMVSAQTNGTTPVVQAPSELVQVSPTTVQPIQAQAAPTETQSVLPANTEVMLSMNEDLTTKGSNIEAGTMFYLTVVSDVKVGNYIVIPKGARGAGEVTWKTGKAVFGKSGKMDIELRWIEVNGQRIQIEGKYRQEGEGNTLAAVGAVFLTAPLLFVTGKSARIPRGRELSARTKYDIPVALPTSAAPVAQVISAQSPVKTDAAPASIPASN